MDLTADASAKLGGSGVSVVSGGSASVESQGSLALSVDESASNGVQVNAGIVSLSSKQAVSVESVGDMKMSSSQSSILADQTMVLSVGAAEASESGVISLEAGNQLDASAGSTNIVATNKEGIKLTK